ncbi:MAG: hypothetical protein CFH19_01003 [Alphaproteobacteria bacterium MarineAlpha5_Bin9]|nr:MAG: hypothetical protein CFH19_01003 [Alphaproteobacteria bacterium MarineAlpha5_Bin9]|tara:strand:+ start:6141 stop:6725 length:585 start_codon:yes stop_codon:yes gene_type:complete
MIFLKKIYNWTLSKADHPKAGWFLSFISFVESSFFPIPPDIILIPMVLANRMKAWIYASICTISSVLGGLAGYCIGAFFYSTIGILIVGYYGLDDKFGAFENWYNTYGAWLVLAGGFTPFPYKFITIASGVFHLNIFIFIIAAIISRGFRFFLLAMLLKIYGDWIKKKIDKYFNILSILFFILFFGGIFLIFFL